MGQKVNPIVFRLAINKNWQSTWFTKPKNYADYLQEDLKIRRKALSLLKHASISKVRIERTGKKLRVVIETSSSGVVIGRKGAGVESVKAELQKYTDKEVSINIVEVKKPEIDAALIARSIADAIERRLSYKKAMKKAIQTAMRYGASGIRINCSGRLNGAEIARMEWQREGRVPLHTLRADIDYALAEAKTTYGILGVKVWVYKGDVSTDQTVPARRYQYAAAQ